MPFRGGDLQLELVDPTDAPLYRLFRHDGGEWAPPPPAKRNLRVDPPTGYKDDFAVLYTADTLLAVAMECRIVSADNTDNYRYNAALAKDYKVARYRTLNPAIFIPLDRPNDDKLGLKPQVRKPGYESFQAVALELFQRFGQAVHGLSWSSFHRNQEGRVYALWHVHKDTVGLELTSSPSYLPLNEDSEGKTLLNGMREWR